MVNPSSASKRSVTLPTPGIFRMGRASTKARMASRSGGSRYWPLGLLMSVQILASILLHAMPALDVSCVRLRHV